MTAPRVVLECIDEPTALRFRVIDLGPDAYPTRGKTEQWNTYYKKWIAVYDKGCFERAVSDHLARQPSAEPIPCAHDWYNGVCRHCLIPADEWRRDTPTPNQPSAPDVWADKFDAAVFAVTDAEDETEASQAFAELTYLAEQYRKRDTPTPSESERAPRRYKGPHTLVHNQILNQLNEQAQLAEQLAGALRLVEERLHAVVNDERDNGSTAYRRARKAIDGALFVIYRQKHDGALAAFDATRAPEIETVREKWREKYRHLQEPLQDTDPGPDFRVGDAEQGGDDE